jgi:hypothetical protein
MQPAAIGKHLDGAFGTRCWVDGDEAVVEWWPFGIVGGKVLIFECMAQCCSDLAGFVIVDLGKEVDIFRRAGDKTVHDHGSAPPPAPRCEIAARPSQSARFVPAADPGACG